MRVAAAVEQAVPLPLTQALVLLAVATVAF
jgi:hypothetical protein